MSGWVQSNMKRFKVKNNAFTSGKWGVGAALFAVLTVVSGCMIGVSAYFTDTDQVENTFTVGKVEIRQHEDQWVPDPKHITPDQVFAKDPSIENTGDTEAFVYETVEVPCRDVITANEDGTKNVKRLTDLFLYQINPEWALIQTENISEGSKIIAHRYTYVYGSAEKCTILPAGKTTPTLFDTVRFANVIEGQGLEDQKLIINVQAYAIQASNLGQNNTSSPLEVFGLLKSQSR